MPLHTVNKSPFASSALASCLDHMTDGSALLLIEDGVYAGLARGTAAVRLAEACRRHQVYVLAPDLAARGLAEHPLVEGLRLVDYAGFVDLAAAHSAVVPWT
jgi:tRNA 2-thiouridine synthesizing protein B